jgi:hypothetical protein
MADGAAAVMADGTAEAMAAGTAAALAAGTAAQAGTRLGWAGAVSAAAMDIGTEPILGE